MSVFSDRLIALRKERGLTQYELAKELDMSRSTLSGYEIEGKEPTYGMLRRFAEYFGVSSDYLLGLSDLRYHADVVFQKDSLNFKKHYDALPAEIKSIVTQTFDSFYVLLFRDVSKQDINRLSIYRDLFKTLSDGRGTVRKLIVDHGVDITDPALLSPLMSQEEDVKKRVGDLLDKLMRSDLNSALNKVLA